MNDIQNFTVFLGWCTVINMSVLLFSAIAIMLLKESISTLHSKLFGINKADLPAIYFQYLGMYKIAIIVFNLTPYIALKIIF
jgi:hypothetical protein